MCRYKERAQGLEEFAGVWIYDEYMRREASNIHLPSIAGPFVFVGIQSFDFEKKNTSERLK